MQDAEENENLDARWIDILVVSVKFWRCTGLQCCRRCDRLTSVSPPVPSHGAIGMCGGLEQIVLDGSKMSVV